MDLLENFEDCEGGSCCGSQWHDHGTLTCAVRKPKVPGSLLPSVVSMDGISAYDQISRAAILDVKGVVRFCHSFGCSTAHPLLIHGKIFVVFLTQSGRWKAENREMR